MIFSIIAILIMVYSLIDFKRGFLTFLIYQIIWFPDTRLITIEGLASINLNLVMSVFFAITYMAKMSKYNTAQRQKRIIKRKIFPYKKPMIAIGVSLLISCFTSVSGFASELVRAIGSIFISLIMVYLIWQIVETKRDFRFLFKGITIVILVACLYGLYEYATKTNPLLEYKFSLAGNELNTYMIGSRGYRMYSIFEHPISAAMIFSLYIIFVLTNLVVIKEKLPFQKLAIITCVFCIPCIVLTKMRTGFVFLALGMFAFIDFGNKKFIKIAFASIVVMLALMPVISDNAILFSSLFNKSVQSAMGGSNLQDRLGQFAAVSQLMMMSPIGGLGEKFRNVVSNIYTTQALDFESLWLEQMAKHGLVGVLAYVYMIFYSLIKVPKEYKSKQVFFISLAYWGTYTLTSTPYFRVYLLYLAIFFFIKKSNVYKKEINQAR